MKTETPPPPPTIAELWELMTARLADANDDLFYMSDRQFFRKEAESIRQQLVERLDLITVGTPKKTRAYMLFGFTGSNDEAISFIPRNDHDEEFKPTIEQCKELSAIFAFCGWELGQRAKEAKGE
jgi:hypothetical protein